MGNGCGRSEGRIMEILYLIGYMILLFILPVAMLIKWNGEEPNERKR